MDKPYSKPNCYLTVLEYGLWFYINTDVLYTLAGNYFLGHYDALMLTPVLLRSHPALTLHLPELDFTTQTLSFHTINIFNCRACVTFCSVKIKFVSFFELRLVFDHTTRKFLLKKAFCKLKIYHYERKIIFMPQNCT